MQALYMILFLLACVLFAAATVGSTVRRLNLQAAGLFCFALVFLIQSINRM